MNPLYLACMKLIDQTRTPDEREAYLELRSVNEQKAELERATYSNSHNWENHSEDNIEDNDRRPLILVPKSLYKAIDLVDIMGTDMLLHL